MKFVDILNKILDLLKSFIEGFKLYVKGSAYRKAMKKIDEADKKAREENDTSDLERILSDKDE